MEERWHWKVPRKLSLESTGLLGASHQKMKVNHGLHTDKFILLKRPKTPPKFISGPLMWLCSCSRHSPRCPGEEGRGHQVTCCGVGSAPVRARGSFPNQQQGAEWAGRLCLTLRTHLHVCTPSQRSPPITSAWWLSRALSGLHAWAKAGYPLLQCSWGKAELCLRKIFTFLPHPRSPQASVPRPRLEIRELSKAVKKC